MTSAPVSPYLKDFLSFTGSMYGGSRTTVSRAPQLSHYLYTWAVWTPLLRRSNKLGVYKADRPLTTTCSTRTNAEWPPRSPAPSSSPLSCSRCSPYRSRLEVQSSCRLFDQSITIRGDFSSHSTTCPFVCSPRYRHVFVHFTACLNLHSFVISQFPVPPTRGAFRSETQDGVWRKNVYISIRSVTTIFLLLIVFLTTASVAFTWWRAKFGC
jgi:hypothetical protein